MSTEFNDKQIQFLKVLRNISIDELIDTNDIWELSTIPLPTSNIITEKELRVIRDTQKILNPNKGVIGTWRKEYLDEWLDKWVDSNKYFSSNNDSRILNSIGRYYIRYVNKKKQ
jgi:hypothetical protein